MYKKPFGVFIYLLLPFAITACGGGSSSGGNNSDTDNPAPIDSSSKTETETETETETDPEIPDIDSDGDGILDSQDADPADSEVTGIVIIRRDKAGVTGSGGTETRFYKYNASEQLNYLKKSTTDADSDGIADHFYTYNSYRQVVTHQIDSNEDGTVEQTYTNTYENSRILEKTAEGTPDVFTETYIYSENSALLLQTDKDTGSDESIDFSDIYTYIDDNPNKPDLIRINVDISDDAEKSIQYSYTPEGQLTSISHDEAEDGSVEGTVTYTYYVSGQVETTEVEGIVEDDQETTVTRLFTYSESGLLQSVEYDNDLNGSWDVKDTYFYASDLLARIETDTNNDGNADAIKSYTYQNNRLSVISEDTDADGNAEITTTYNYDSGQRLTSVVVDHLTDNTQDETVVFTYQGYLDNFTVFFEL